MNILIDSIVDHPVNIQNLKLLIDSFNRNQFVPFIGAGSSIPLGEPAWDELFKKMKNKYNVSVYIKKINGVPDYPGAFSRLYKKLKEKRNFYENLFDTLKPKITSGTNLHLRLVDAFDCYATTNYDIPIEKAYLNQKKLNLYKYYFFCPQPNQNLKDSIVYLHGHKNIDFAIILREDYNYFYPTISNKKGIPILETFLKHLYQNKCLVFVGFSFSDPYIRDYFKYLTKTIPDIQCDHFLIIDEDVQIYKDFADKADKYKQSGLLVEADHKQHEFYNYIIKEYNIHPIVYKSGVHIFAENLFESLGNVGRNVRIIEESISGEIR